MAVDVVETTAAARTYTVPAAVVASVSAALADQSLADHPDNSLADRIVSGRVTADDVMTVYNPTDTDGYRLRGGDTGHQWAERIVDGIMRELDRARDQKLADIDYDPDTYHYVGITSDSNEDLITQVVRFPTEDNNLERAEALVAAGWRTAIFDFAGEDAETYGVALDSTMLAFTASAIVDDGVSGVLLAYGEPITFLPEQPLLASAPLEPPDDGNVYAIVDANDTTAVMDVILITPGPIVYRRNGGRWQEDKVLLESFMSPAPPVIVELTGTAKDQIVSQVDQNAANQVVADPKTGIARAGEGAQQVDAKPTTRNPATKKQTAKVDAKALKPDQDATPPGTPAPPENRPKRTPEDSEEGPNSKPPVTAAGVVRADYNRALATVARLRENDIRQAAETYYSDGGYASGFSLTAALAQIDARAITRERTLRRLALTAAGADLRAARARALELQNVVIPAIVAASAAGNEPFVHEKPGQRKAENLRKYWVHGEGAVKIKWGAKGDFTRCVRQLRKYLGARTEGYCALRHREAAGMWPGDRRNK